VKRYFVLFALLAGLAGLAAGQTAEPAFEAADVHVSPPGATPDGGFLPNGRVEFRATTLLRLIGLAYSVPSDRIDGGPSWLDTDRFDVVAKADPGATPTALRKMMQNLLVERFELSVETADKPVPVYALMLAKAGVAKESTGADAPDCKGGSEENVRTYTCHKITIESLADRLRMAAPAYFELPVVDRTGLKGAYDFKLQWLPRAQLPAGAEGQSLSIYTSIEKQLGIHVEKQRAPMPVLSVNKVNRTPVDNPPGVAEKLGPTPTEFEVAEIKRSRPDEQPDADIKNGRIDARALSLRDLISFAYNVEDDWVKGGEKWLDTDHFDILAKTAPTESEDTLRTMLQALLAERFKLKVHREQQPVTVYALTAGKPKLQAADPSQRSTCRNAAAHGSRIFSCQNITMAQFAEKLRGAAGGYLEHPVVDLTNLKGAYDFTLSYLPRARVMGSRPAGSGGDSAMSGAVPTASDRPVGLTIFEAVDRQMGLKLATRKHPMPVIVVDHVERNPTEN
jgi:uncharacterized protein (TIGR03435 family)